jgi:hydroxymethylpyrimidine/phosphomethylpyrimidine kinase
MNRALTIAGSDSGGGAGIQADLKTFTAFRVFGTSAITALTAQNSTGVQGILEIDPEFVVKQISSVLNDIGTDAIKTGMLGGCETVEAVAETLKKYKSQNIVVDPVMIAKSGDHLLSPDAIISVIGRLIPMARVVTPNIHEAQVMLNMEIKNLHDMKQAAERIKDMGCGWVVIKGGHMEDSHESVDIAYNGDQFFTLTGPRIETKNSHGTGCTFSSAIAAGLAKGYDMVHALQTAKKFISAAISEGISLGEGHGPTNHFVGTTSKW